MGFLAFSDYRLLLAILLFKYIVAASLLQLGLTDVLLLFTLLLIASIFYHFSSLSIQVQYYPFLDHGRHH